MEAGDSARVVVEPEVVVERGEGKMSDYYNQIFDSTELENQLMDYLVKGDLGPQLKPYYEEFAASNPVGDDPRSMEFVDYMKGLIQGMVPQPSEVPQTAGPRVPKWPFAGKTPEGGNAGDIFTKSIKRMTGE